MTPAELIQKVRELDKAATSGPWKQVGEEVHERSGAYISRFVGFVREQRLVKNSALIAEFRTLAPLLATELEKCLARERILRDELEYVASGEDVRSNRVTRAREALAKAGS